MYTIDASVWVNGFDHRESGYEISREVLDHIGSTGLPIILPHLALVEIAGAISRTRQNADQAQVYVSALRALPNVTFELFDEAFGIEACALAAQHGLRGADAI